MVMSLILLAPSWGGMINDQGDLALNSGNYDLSYQGNNLTITKALLKQGGLGLVSGNYDLAYQGNNLTITKALLNVIADDADPSLTYQVSGLKNGDTAGAVLNGGSLSRVAGENPRSRLRRGSTHRSGSNRRYHRSSGR